LCVGFGVASPGHVRDLGAAGADGVIVGSAVVAMVEKGASPAELEAFVRGLKQATRA
jgi:tryptophan synthase alpha chain